MSGLEIRAPDGTVAVFRSIVHVVRVIVTREGQVVFTATMVMN